MPKLVDMRLMFKSLFVLCVLVLCGFVLAYEPTDWDNEITQKIEDKISEFGDTDNKEGLIYLFLQVEEKLQTYKKTDAQGVYLLRHILDKAKDELIDAFGVSLHSDYLDQEVEDIVLEEEEDYEEEQEFISYEEDELPEGVYLSIPSSSKQMTLEDFYDEYNEYLTNPEPLPERCFNYYDEIDALAKAEDFPTALIIAMWYREHSCWFDNPANGDGNFQIVAHYYEPGDITWQDFAEQVHDFIDFAHAKWERYDDLQAFDTLHVHLSYDKVDLLSLRKHAVLYNGIYDYTTPQTSTYANQNFGRTMDGRDGIVAAFLKAVDQAPQ